MRFSIVLCLGLLLHGGAASKLRAVTAARPARIVRPGELARLDVRGAPAGARIRFELPENGAGGRFADGSFRLVATASAAGVAEASFTVGGVTGPLLADVTVLETGARTSFAITVLALEDALPAVSADQARDAASQLAAGAEVAHGPVLVRAGVEIRPPAPAVAFDRNAPIALARDAWLAWIDSAPGARFGHPVRWALIGAEDGAVRTLHQDWWPELRSPGALEARPLLGASRVNRRLGGSVTPSPLQPSPDACFVGVIGDRLPRAIDDLTATERLLGETARIAANRMYSGRTASQARDALSTALEEGCRRLFLLVSAHAGQARGGGILLEPEDGEAYLTYAELVEWLAPFTSVEAILATSFAEDAASWFDGRGFDGVVLPGAFAQAAPPLDPVGRLAQAAAGAATLAEAHAAAFADGSAPPPHLIRAAGERRFWLSDVAIGDAGGEQRIDVTRPLNLDLGPTLIYNASVADAETAGQQTKVFVLPSDQDFLRFAFGGIRRGETLYSMTLNDSARQVYTATGRIEIGSFTAAPDGAVMRLGDPAAARRTVAIARHGYWLRRGAPTRFHLSSRDGAIAVPAEAVVETDGASVAFELRATGAGRTFIDIWDETADNAATIEVEVLGPPNPVCPLAGSAPVSFVVAPGGDPNGFAVRVALTTGTLYWRREGARIELWGDRAPMVTAEGVINADCTFSAAGSSGQERVAGMRGLGAVYENGRISANEIRFEYRLGPFDGGESVGYIVTGAPTMHAGPLGTGPLLINQTGGELSVAVGAPSQVGWTASSDSDWIRILGDEQGQGPGFVRLLIPPNGTASRRHGRLTAAGGTVTIAQASGPDIAEPLVVAVRNGATFQEGATGGGWLTISGFGLADTTASWFSDEGAGVQQDVGLLPTELAGVSVEVDGRPAYVQFVSPGQINVLAPGATPRGRVEVKVTNRGRVSSPVRVAVRDVAPELFRFLPREGRFPAAVHPDGVFAGPAGLFRTVTTRPAEPGDIVLLFGTGFGETDPPAPEGLLVTGPLPLAAPVVATVGGRPAEVLFAGLVGAGLFQINLVTPELPPGDHRIELFADGRPLETTAYLRVE